MPSTDILPPVDWDVLIRQVREGHQPAARSMVDALYGLVMRIIRSHLPRAADEEDIAQDIYMKVFTRIDSYRHEQPFPHWVSRIAVNTCYDRLRRQRSRPEIRFADLGEAAADFLEAALTGTAEENHAHTGPDAAEVVDQLISTLKPREQVVLRMLDLEEKSVKEIAGLTGWGESMIKVTAMRARRKLNLTLKKMEGGLHI